MSKQAVVIDTNLLFSALIPKASKIRDVLFEGHLICYAPNFLITEIYRHKEKLIKQSKLSEPEFYSLFNNLIECVHFVPLEFFSIEAKQAAYNLCHDVDIKDTPFIALAIALDIPIWTGDKKLKDGLSAKGFSSFYRP